MNTIDARGLSCPQPVILTKKALAENTGAELTVLVDNETAAKNVKNLGDRLGHQPVISQLEKGTYAVVFAAASGAGDGQKKEDAYVVVLSSQEMGTGDTAFGRKLMEGFLYALTEQDHLPAYILCVNRGIALTTENEKAIADLKALEDKGVEVLSCGLCLEYYGLKEQLKVGQVTNMYRICELMTSYPTVRP
ncbi:MAG: sulfurtransferase-like selenium metabolism protein YedF [Clostridiales bacterium]|nr:sulfurtransferase-like selenium metabolism protein YedF [Clostridiales bacterium]